MIRKNTTINIVYIISFLGYFLASFSAFIGVIWLETGIVLVGFTCWLVLAILAFWLLRRNGTLPVYFQRIKQNWFIIPFVMFSGLTIFGSVVKDISFYRWIIFLATIIVGGYIGLHDQMKGIVRSLTEFTIFILFISILFIIFIPNSGVMNYHNIHDAWKGIYWHKNHMGLIASFANLLFLINLFNSFSIKKRQGLFWPLLYLFSLYFIYRTNSVAAYLTTIITTGLVVLIYAWLKLRARLKKIHYIVLVIILLIGLILLFTNMEQFLNIFNRNSSLTGRIPMWTYLYSKYISSHPLSGFGFNAFWYLESHRIGVQKVGYPDPIVISDNGFIDILTNTGFIGLFLFLMFYFGIWWRSIKFSLKSNNINGFFPIIVMSFIFIANISWSLLFENESFFMLIMVIILFCVTTTDPNPTQNSPGEALPLNQT